MLLDRPPQRVRFAEHGDLIGGRGANAGMLAVTWS
jgi:hypothetical protein